MILLSVAPLVGNAHGLLIGQKQKSRLTKVRCIEKQFHLRIAESALRHFAHHYREARQTSNDCCKIPSNAVVFEQSNERGKPESVDRHIADYTMCISCRQLLVQEVEGGPRLVLLEALRRRKSSISFATQPLFWGVKCFPKAYRFFPSSRQICMPKNEHIRSL